MVRYGFLAAAAFLFVSCNAQPSLNPTKDDDSVIFKIGSVYLTKSEMESRLLELGPDYVPYLRTGSGKKTIMTAILKQKILVRAALDRGLDKNEGVKQEMARLKKEQDRALRLYRENLLTQSLLEDLRRKELHVDDEEIAAYHRDHPALYQVRQILIGDKEKAQEIYDELRKRAGNFGAEFARAAARYSLESASAKEGGKIPPFFEGELEQSFVRAAASLKPGQVSGPVESKVGFHLIYLEGTLAAPFNEETAQRIRRILERGKMDALMDLWRGKYVVEVRDETLKPYLEF